MAGIGYTTESRIFSHILPKNLQYLKFSFVRPVIIRGNQKYFRTLPLVNAHFK